MADGNQTGERDEQAGERDEKFAAEESSKPLRRRVALYSSAIFAVLLGVFSGVGIFTFGYGKGASYLSSDPKGCANCHVMQDHFDSWQKSSHHHVAVCNDCHLPHDFVGKCVTKADNGFFHSLAFTLQNYHDPIQIKPRNRVVTQNACIDCHKDFVQCMLPVEQLGGSADAHAGEMLWCVHCHSDVGHAFRSYSEGSKRESATREPHQ